MVERQIIIPIRYDGIDASRHEIDIIELGQSLQGAGKLIRAASSVVISQPKIAAPTTRMRVMARQPEAGSYVVTAVVAPLLPLIPGILPSAGKLVELLVSYTISKFTRKSDATDKAFELARLAVEENGMTARAAIEAMTRVTEGQRSAVRQFVAPIGDSCGTAQIGSVANGVLTFNKSDREDIDSPDAVQLGEAGQYDIIISELDVKNRTCKFNVIGSGEERRLSGSILDPAIISPRNNYSLSLSEHHRLKVTAKPEIVEGEVTYLHISDSSL